MIENLFQIERDAYKDSIIHRIDARVKIAIAFAAIIALVAVPYSTMIYTVGIIFFLFFCILWACTRLSFVTYLRRAWAIIPLWGVIIFFQIFLKNKYYTEYDVLYSLPFGISIYAQSVEFAFILLVKFVICISFIILLSSTTKMYEMLEGAARMGLPAEFALALGMMIRYLFVFGYMFRKINETLKTKCFDALIATCRTGTASANWVILLALCSSGPTSRASGCIPACSAGGMVGTVTYLSRGNR
jgi:cobalt/nickel transport system permease protein